MRGAPTRSGLGAGDAPRRRGSLLAGEPVLTGGLEPLHFHDAPIRHRELHDDIRELLEPEAVRFPRYQRLRGLPREHDAEAAVLPQNDLEFGPRRRLAGPGILP